MVMVVVEVEVSMQNNGVSNYKLNINMIVMWIAQYDVLSVYSEQLGPSPSAELQHTQLPSCCAVPAFEQVFAFEYSEQLGPCPTAGSSHTHWPVGNTLPLPLQVMLLVYSMQVGPLPTAESQQLHCGENGVAVV